MTKAAYALMLSILALIGLFAIFMISDQKKKKEARKIAASKAELIKKYQNIENQTLSLRIQTKSTDSNKSNIIESENMPVSLPFSPSCASLAKQAQAVYDTAYSQGQTPVSVKFYGTSNYENASLKLLEQNYRYDGDGWEVYTPNDKIEYLNDSKTVYKEIPTTITCRLRNASFVEYSPTGNKHCQDIAISYHFKENRYSYGQLYHQYCSNQN